MRCLTFFLIALIAAACGDSTDPNADVAAGTYVLQSINGTNLPAPWDVKVNSSGVTYASMTMIRDTIHLRPDRTYRRVATFQVYENGQLVDTRTAEIAGTYKSAPGYSGAVVLVTITEDGVEAPATGLLASNQMSIKRWFDSYAYKR